MKQTSVTGIFVASALLAGCASTPDVADTGIVRAETTIETAAESGAQEHASGELDDAREKLVAAKLAAEQGDEEEAARLAKEAELKAQVAMAQAEHAEADESLREVQQGIETLRQELQMNNTNPGGTQ